MHVPRDARFDEDAERFALRFCCEDCGFFDARGERCRHGWPTALHRTARYRARLPVVAGDEGADRGSPDPEGGEGATEVVFCKEFELR